MCSDNVQSPGVMSMTPAALSASLTPDTPARADGARWVVPGEPQVVAGVAIARGFVYVDDTADPQPSPLDSCVVSTALDIAPDVPLGPDGQPDYTNGPTAAWLSYAALSPVQRRTWLHWLASDRESRNVHVGYLNLYLYGLERRALLDGSNGMVDDAEYAAIAHELRRLFKLSADWAFQMHVENLIESVTVLQTAPARLYDQAPTVRATRGYQVPFTVRVAFGQAAVDNAPVPAEWAYAWASLDSAITRKPPLGRVGDAFRLMFIKQYRARVRDGMHVSVNRTRLKFPDTAFPALRELDVPESVGILPDLSAVTVPRGRLQQLVNDCADALGPYGRYLTRNPGAEGSLDAALMLSQDLWPESIRKALDALAHSTREQSALIRFSDLLALFRTPATLSRDKIVTFVSVLGQAGIGIEPDIRTGARTPRPDDRVALFALDPDTRLVDEDCAYLTAALMIDVAATLAMADGEATHPELTLMHHHIEHAMHLSVAQQQRLKARLAVQISAPQSLATLKKRLEPLSSDARHVLAAFLVQTANADGVVTPEEVRLLEKIYRMLDLDTQQLYNDLHQDASGVTLGGGRARNTAGARAQARQQAFALDAARISALQTETAQVSALLAQVFAQDADDRDEPASADPADAALDDAVAQADATQVLPASTEPVSSPSTLLGLDDAHSTFLRLLVSRPRWTRQELIDAAADLELMLDGAIEQVNEASLDHWDEPLTDGDDPVEINQELAQRLAA